MTAPDLLSHGPAALAAIPLLGLGINVAVLLLLCRVPLLSGQVRRQFVGFGCGLAVTATGLLVGLHRQPIGPADCLGYFLLNFLSYAFLGFCFFNVINLNSSSLRIRMLREYLGQFPHPLSDSSLMTRYNVREMLEMRLARLKAGNQITESGDRFLSQHGATRWIGYIFTGLRRLVIKD